MKPQVTVSVIKDSKETIARFARASHLVQCRMEPGAMLSQAHVCAEANGQVMHVTNRCALVSLNVVGENMVCATLENGNANALGASLGMTV